MQEQDKKLDQDTQFFGRRIGRRLQKERQRVLDEVLPDMQVDLDVIRQNGIPEKSWLEIGFGNGEHLAGMAQRHPDTTLFGCEPFMNGMSAFLVQYQNLPTPKSDVHVWPQAAQLLMDVMPDKALERVYLLNPDPWPKLRHHKRRFVNSGNLDRIARLLKPGGLFITATDVDDLAEWMLEKTVQHPAFEWTAKKRDDWEKMPEDWIKTRYQEKGKDKGHTQRYLIFRRTNDTK